MPWCCAVFSVIRPSPAPPSAGQNANVPHSPGLKGYFAHKKQLPPRTLQQDYAYGPVAVLGGWAVFIHFLRDPPQPWEKLSRVGDRGVLADLLLGTST